MQSNIAFDPDRVISLTLLQTVWVILTETMSLSNPKVAVLLNKKEVQVVEWQNYLKENWKIITAYLEQNAKIVIIAGRHGDNDGKTYERRPEDFILENHKNLVGYF